MNELTGIKESDTGLAAPALWDLAADKQTLTNEQPLQVYILIRFSPLITIWVNQSKFVYCKGGTLHQNHQCGFRWSKIYNQCKTIR